MSRKVANNRVNSNNRVDKSGTVFDYIDYTCHHLIPVIVSTVSPLYAPGQK